MVLFNPRCSICEKPSAQNCPDCNRISYCSNSCKSIDRKLHDHVCFSGSELLSPPQDGKLRVFFFPEHKDALEIIWLPYGHNDEKREQTLEDKALIELLKLPSPNSSAQAIIPERQQLIRWRLRHNLYLYCRTSFLHDGSGPNRSIRNMTQGQMRRQWIGPVVVAAESAKGLNRLEDVTMHDLRDIVEYLQEYV